MIGVVSRFLWCGFVFNITRNFFKPLCKFCLVLEYSGLSRCSDGKGFYFFTHFGCLEIMPSGASDTAQ